MSASGEIVTFYSYKGGTGRTLMLANVAWILASNGHRVLAVDWDLEAPGLHRYLEPFLVDKDLSRSEGIIDLVTDFATEAATLEEPPSDDWFEPYADIRAYGQAAQWEFPPGGALHYVPAGRQGPSYATRVNAFNWESFYEGLGGGAFFEAVKAGMRAHYDWVLIDSRTGVSDTSGICTVQMPDTLVACFTLNNQGIDGAAGVTRSVLDQRGIRVLPVPMRVENSEQDRLRDRRRHARTSFSGLPNDPAVSDQDRYWREVEVPYVPLYAYEEMLATFTDTPGDAYTILGAAENVTRYLTRGAVEHVVAAPDSTRSEVRAAYERRADAGTATVQLGFDVYLSYGRSVSAEAIRIAEVLLAAAMKPWVAEWAVAPGEALDDAMEAGMRASRACAVLVGPEPLTSWQEDEISLALARASADRDFRVFAVLLPGAPEPAVGLPPLLSARAWVDLRDELSSRSIGRRLIPAVRGIAPGRVTPAPAPPSPGSPPTRTPVAEGDPANAARLLALGRRLEIVERGLELLLGQDADPALRDAAQRFVFGAQREARYARHQLQRLERALEAGETPAERVWMDYQELERDTRQLFAGCLELVGGLGMRRQGLDLGLAALADGLLNELARTALAAPLDLITVPSVTRHPILHVSKLPTAEWSVWTVPLVVFDLARTALQEGPLREVAQRSRRHDETRVRTSPETLLADALATSVVGPAYACAALQLELQPRDAERAETILRTFRSVGSAEPEGEIQAVGSRLEGSWRRLMEYDGSAHAVDDSAHEFIAELVEELGEIVDWALPAGAVYGDARRLRQTSLAATWEQAIAQGRPPELPADTAVVGLTDALNAAWLVRLLGAPGDMRSLEDWAGTLCRSILERDRTLASTPGPIQIR